MHDDDHLEMSGEASLPEKYWTEKDWETFLVENEKLMDQYEKVYEENPARRWDDPADLYLKVHHGIDLGEEFQAPVRVLGDEEKTDESSSAYFDSEEGGGIFDLERSSVYQSAFSFGMELLDWIRPHTFSPQTPEDDLARQLCFHGLKIGADIAGGIGLGCDEDGRCGNIVKHRWALSHAREAACCLKVLRDQYKVPEGAEGLTIRLHELQQEIEREITSLRSRVWCDR